MKNFFLKNKISASIVLVFIVSIGIFTNLKTADAQGSCAVTSAKFRTGSNAPYPAQDFTSPGASSRTIVYVDVMTTGCLGQTIQVSIPYYTNPYSPSLYLSVLSGAVFFDPTSVIPGWHDLDNADNIPVTITAGLENFSLEFLSAEEGCNALVTHWDCQYAIKTWNDNSSLNSLDVTEPQWQNQYTNGTASIANMSLLYDCFGTSNCLTDGLSQADWQRIGGVYPYEFFNPTDDYNTTNESAIPIEGEDYYLAPLPGFPATCTTPPCSGLGEFLKGLFTVLIVIAGIMAFVMIVLGAITYATTDSFSGSEHGRDMIWNAVMGLVLALGAWIILNAINPNLASNLSITIPKVSMNPAFEPDDSVGEGISQITVNSQSGGSLPISNCDVSQMVSVTAFGHTFKIYQGLVANIQAVDAQWQAAGGDTFYEINSIGGYNCRRVRGTNSWSAHAFGMAVDINPKKNPFGPDLITDMPPAFVQMWTSHGWGWGGSWSSRKDAMHFSKYPPSEGGDGIIN